MTNQDLLTYLCKKHKVLMPYLKYVDSPHWQGEDERIEGYYVPKVHILCIWKGAEDKELVLAHEFHHYVDEVKGDLLQRLEKRLSTEDGVHKRAVRDLAEFRAAS